MKSSSGGVRSLLTDIHTHADAQLAAKGEETGRDSIRLPRWLTPLQRRTSGRPLLAVVDGLRFYAIGAVMLYHIVYNLQKVPGAVAESAVAKHAVHGVLNGFFGVQLFFVISGMVLGLPFANAASRGTGGVALGRYFSRRLTRLEPPFLLSIGLLFLVRAFVVGLPDLAPHLLATSLYSHNWWFKGPSSISAVTWSLEVEVQFYILAPLLGRLYLIPGRWRRRGVWLLLMAVVQGLQYVLPASGFVHLGQFICYFLAGMLLADITVFDWKGGHEVRWHRAWDLVGVACAVVVWMMVDARVMPQAVLALLVLISNIAVIRGAVLYRFTTLPVVFTFGGMCYTIYLYHNAILRGLFEKTPLVAIARDWFGTDLGLILIALVACLVVAGWSAVFFALIERPCMDPQWFKRLRGRLTGRTHDA